MRDIVIVGAGPAGLAAAVYAIRKRLDVMVVAPDVGGKTNYRFHLPWFEDHQVIRGRELVDAFRRELEYLDFIHVRDSVKEVSRAEGVFRVELSAGRHELSRTVVFAAGVSRIPLDVPGERRFLSHGLGYSSLSYSHLFSGRSIFLCGNGPRVIRSALEAALHAEHVVVALEPEAGDDAERYPRGLVTRLRERPNVEVLERATVLEFEGGDYAEFVRLRVHDGAMSDADVRRIRADGFFAEREPVANSFPVADIAALESHGRLVIDVDGRTSAPGLFAAGDVTATRQEQVLIALGQGAASALSAYEYLVDVKS